MTFNELFQKLRAINVNEHTEVKDSNGVKLTYLSWAWAWDEFMKVCPDATYEIETFNGLPYQYDPHTGYMVFTNITACGLTKRMWLPVMDSHNAAMKSEPYEVHTKYKTYTIPACTMFDVNKTIMRCLVKNIAMFGLGLYIYAGEDLPADAEEEIVLPKEPVPKQVDKEKVSEIEAKCNLVARLEELGVNFKKMLEHYGYKSVDEMPIGKLEEAVRMKESA